MKILTLALATTLALSALTVSVAAANPTERNSKTPANSMKEMFLGTSVILAAKRTTPGTRAGHIMINCKPGNILEIGVSFYKNALSGDPVMLTYRLDNEPTKTATFWTKPGKRKNAVFRNKSTPAMEITRGLFSSKQLRIQGYDGSELATNILEFQTLGFSPSHASILEHCPVEISYRQ